ncbi:MAG: hypothetical protein NC120_04495 [Ruminococcus sp.]|nr:hypothetical protein [Ruminococcus sp.]
MAQYGYLISNLPRNEKYAETEAFLDKKLKGFEKDNAVFEKDGSMKQVYRRTDEDGGVTEVSIVKNITESSIVVFSDIPLKYFKRGGAVLFARDIAPSALFGVFYWAAVGTELMRRFMFGFDVYIPALLISVVLAAAINMISMNYLRKNRSLLRVQIIQMGSVFIIIPAAVIWLRMFVRGSLTAVIFRYLQSPIPTALAAAVITRLIVKITGRNRYE